MNAELEILGVKLKHYHVDAAMEIVEEYLSNDKLNTIGIVTMQMLMQASKEPTWKQYIEDLDLTVIGETEVLEAAGIDPETPSYEEVETNEFIARFFWGLIQKKSRIFVLGDTGEELQTITHTSSTIIFLYFAISLTEKFTFFILTYFLQIFHNPFADYQLKHG